MGIVHAGNLPLLKDIDPLLKQLCDDLIWNRNGTEVTEQMLLYAEVRVTWLLCHVVTVSRGYCGVIFYSFHFDVQSAVLTVSFAESKRKGSEESEYL